MLQSPLIFTNSPNDTAILPYDTLIGYRLIGMTTHSTFKGELCYHEPYNATEAYYFLKGLNSCGQQMINPVTNQPTKYRFSGNACNRTGWLDTAAPTGQDRRNFAASGPFSMNSGDTQIVVVTFMVSRDGGTNFQNVCACKLIDTALKYYNDFRIMPI
jgi:hypothetical protein